MTAFLNSFLIVALAEMGDRTQILSLLLAAQFKKKWTILLGVFIATVLNHALAAASGQWISTFLTPFILNVCLTVLFLGFALWILIPDRLDEQKPSPRFGALITTIFAFFMAEMGDKTQFATITLAAQYQSTLWVTLGTTCGMLFSNGLAIFLGEKLTQKISLTRIRWIASALYFIFGILTAIEALKIKLGN
ncbi:TMEM165/GDT1 family protein [bacterium]|jgi:putative Ca2+/H+ antiporter (TMEM165/GDT1 family)|nr:TMEM165/GDT1 family protein [bacterium]